MEFSFKSFVENQSSVENWTDLIMARFVSPHSDVYVPGHILPSTVPIDISSNGIGSLLIKIATAALVVVSQSPQPTRP
jgi:hypothetical protein